MVVAISTQWAILKTFSNEPLKQKTTMKKNSFLWAALSMTAALVMTACSNDDNANESPVQQSTVKTIPYSVTVNEGATTRATVDSDNKTLKFADGDKLYITGTNIKGVLDIQMGATTTSATFSGDLTYSGEGSPAADLELTATLVSAQQSDGSEITVDATTGAVTVNYPTTSYCTSVNDAVQKYSNLTGTSTYSAKSFSLTQQTAFLNFEITVTGSSSGTPLPADVISGGASIAKANVTTVTDNGVKAKFVLPVAAGTELNDATVKLGGIEIGSTIGNASLSSGKVYNVKRTVDMLGVTLAQTLNTADMAVKVKYYYENGENYCLFSSNGDETYTFQSGDGWAGDDEDCAKALVVEGGKLVFKQNFWDTIDDRWSMFGFSVTFDTSNNTYSNWVGGSNYHNPYFISVEVNSVPIALTQKITVSDLVKEQGQYWSEIISNNPGKIQADGDNVVRISDNAKLQQYNSWGDMWDYVMSFESYQPGNTYKFEGD